MHVQVVQNVLKLNDEIADMNRTVLRKVGVFTIDLIGAPGCGKTALIEKTLGQLKDLRIGIIVGDLTTQRDADRMAKFTDQVVQVNTGKGCHLEANHLKEALPHLEFAKLDLLIIENVGNLICPVGFDLGQDAKVGMFAISGGDDKAAKHPYIVIESAVLLLSKMDLLPYIPFDMELFKSDIRRLNPNVPLMELSVTTGKGLDAWLNWLRERAARTRRTLRDGI